MSFIDYLLTSYIPDTTLTTSRKFLRKIENHCNMVEELHHSLNRRQDYIDPNFDLVYFTNIDINASILLALHGFYDAAIATLRLVLETSVKKIWAEVNLGLEWYSEKVMKDLSKERKVRKNEGSWNKCDESEYWKTIKLYNPTFKTQIDYLFSWITIAKYNLLVEGTFRDEIQENYDLCCSYIHPSSKRVVYRDAINMFPTFDEKQLEKWCDIFCTTLKLQAIMLFFVEETIFSLKKYPSRTFLKLYPSEYIKIQEAIKFYWDEDTKYRAEKEQRINEDYEKYYKFSISRQKTIPKFSSSLEVQKKIDDFQDG